MKKHLKLIIVLSVIGVILIGAAVTFVLAKEVIINKFMLMTKSEAGYFQWVAGREVDEACKKIESSDALKKTAEGMFPGQDGGVIKAAAVMAVIAAVIALVYRNKNSKVFRYIT